MKTRNLIVRLMNVGFIAGAALATWGIVAKPILEVGVEATLPNDSIVDLINSIVPSEEDSSTPQKPLKNMGTEELLNEIKENPARLLKEESITEGVFTNLKVKVDVALPSLVDYLKTEKEERPFILNTVVTNTITNFTNDLLPQLSGSFTQLTKNVARFASGAVVQDAIKEQIKNTVGEGGNVDGAFANVTDEQINSVVDSVWNAMETGEATVGAVVASLQGSVNDVLMTLGQSENNEGFVDKDGNPIQIEEKDLKPIEDNMNDMLGKFNLIDEEGKITDISAAMSIFLDMFNDPSALSDPEAQHDDDSTPVENPGGEENPPEGENQEKAIKRAGVTRSETDNQSNDVLKSLVNKLLEKIPTDKLKINLDELVEERIGIENFTTIAYAGLCGLAALPWLLFIIFTLIRTIKIEKGPKKKKIWAKPWFIFVFAFIEFVLGAIGLFLLKPIDGLQYVKPLILNLEFTQGDIPNTPLKISTLIEGANLIFNFHTVVAAAVYLTFIPYTIVYMFFAHGPKKEYKQYKKDKKAARKAGLSLEEYLDQKNRNTIGSAINTSSTKKEAKRAAKIAKEKQ